MIGHVIGNYRIVGELGRGGMGLVYRAEHTQLGRPAALKMLLPQFSSDPTIVQRFFNEARAASAIDHPGIVEVYDFGTHSDGRAYIVMPLLKGESLEQRLSRGVLPAAMAASVAAQVAAALSAAHHRGIVHRDLKPDNIFLVPNDLMPGGVQVKLLDFGIAKLADDRVTGVKTQTGALMGTPAYMSPEQCMGRTDLDHRTDLYSMGCILFHALCGRPPFISDQGAGMMIASHLRDPAPHPRTVNPTVPDALSTIVLRLLEKDPAARFQTADELRTTLATAGAIAPVTQTHAAELELGATLPGSMAMTGPGARGPHQTTNSGSAAEIVAQQATPAGAPRRRGALAAGIAAVVVVAGAGAVIYSRSGSSSSPGESVALTPTPEAPLANRPAVAPPPVTPPPDPIAAVSADPCPVGQARTADTSGNCCWPEQAWSSAKRRCIGKPRCPPQLTVRGDDCTAPGSAKRPAIGPVGNDVISQPVAARITFALDKRAYAPGEDIEIRFGRPVSSPANSRAWVTVIEAQQPDTAWGTWTYVTDGAATATLQAPTRPGPYQVRLHTDYPTKRTNVVHRIALTVDTPAERPLPPPTPRAQQRFSVADATLSVGAVAQLHFATAMVPATNEKFWITVVPRKQPDSKWGQWEYLTIGATELKLKMPSEPGEYEIRLHANYPRMATNVVHRVVVRLSPN
ncbi:MAG: protein kinase [Kofleriaceae bacterium]